MVCCLPLERRFAHDSNIYRKNITDGAGRRCYTCADTRVARCLEAVRTGKREEVYGHDCSTFESSSGYSVWHSDFDFPAFFELFRGDLADSARTPGLGRGTLTLSSMDRQTTQYGPIPR